MTSLQVDAVSSFVYLTDNVPSWLTRLTDLSKYASQKNSDFVAEYTNLVNQVKPKRIRSPSITSIHSNDSRSAHLPSIDPRTDTEVPTPPNPVDIDPLEAGNKYLYAQVQRKRKPTSSVRSGASGPQKFRSRNEVVIYYDSHVQTELDSMVKAVGLARNNLRKGRNALHASNGFALPSLGKKLGSSLTPSMDNLKPPSMSRTSNPALSTKYNLTSSPQASSHGDETLFTSTDKILEVVHNLFETAAHQFLRDGDCKTELDSASTHLDALLEEAKSAIHILQEKAEKQKEEAARAESDTASEISEMTPPLAFDPLLMVNNKYGPTSLSQTLEDMKNRPILAGPLAGDVSSLPTAGVEIEVDTDDDGDSIGEIDMSQFRAANRGRVARAC